MKVVTWVRLKKTLGRCLKVLFSLKLEDVFPCFSYVLSHGNSLECAANGWIVTVDHDSLVGSHDGYPSIYSSNHIIAMEIPILNRKYIFKWWIFHCHVSFPEGISKSLQNLCKKGFWASQSRTLAICSISYFWSWPSIVELIGEACQIGDWAQIITSCPTTQTTDIPDILLWQLGWWIKFHKAMHRSKVTTWTRPQMLATCNDM